MDEKDLEVSLFYLIYRGTVIHARIQVFSQVFSAFQIGLVFKFLTHLLHRVPQAKQSKELLTKEVHLLSEETKHFFKEKRRNAVYFIW